MATFNHEIPVLTGNLENDVKILYKSQVELITKLNYLLNNLDDENINAEALKGTKNGQN